MGRLVPRAVWRPIPSSRVLDTDDVVELFDVERRRIQRCDLTGAVPVVVHHDLVEHVVVELEEVRSAVDRSSNGMKFAMSVTRSGWAGLTKAYTSVLSASGSWLVSGASRWLDA